MIKEKIEEIKKKRKEDIGLRFEKLKSNAKILVQFAHILKSFDRSEGKMILLDRNQQFKEEWNKNSNSLMELASEINTKIGSCKEGNKGLNYQWSGALQAVEVRIDKDTVEICIMGPEDKFTEFDETHDAPTSNPAEEEMGEKQENVLIDDEEHDDSEKKDEEFSAESKVESKAPSDADNQMEEEDEPLSSEEDEQVLNESGDDEDEHEIKSDETFITK